MAPECDSRAGRSRVGRRSFLRRRRQTAARRARRRETAIWEIFHGHLLAESHTRRVEEFETWNVFLDERSQPAETPLVSIRWQPASSRIYVVRRILTHGFEAYEDSPGVILSREAQKWVAELVATIDLAALGPDDLESELRRVVFHGGDWHQSIADYVARIAAAGFFAGTDGLFCRVWPRRSDQRTIRGSFSARPCVGSSRSAKWPRRSNLLCVPRRQSPRPRSLRSCEKGLRNIKTSRAGEAALFRALFNSAVLSPYSGYVDALVGVLLDLASRGEADAGELGRHDRLHAATLVPAPDRVRPERVS